jgi:transforming growth factor-beta-induced protein
MSTPNCTFRSGPGPFTVFAPTNAAFDELPRGVLEELLKPENKATLVKVLTYHVVSGKVMAKDLTNEQKVTTVEGSNVTVHLLRDSRGVRVMIQDLVPNSRWADVIQADVEASNGVVHVVDRVLIPGKLMDTIKALAPRAPNIVELAASVPELSTLVAAVKAAGLVDTLYVLLCLSPS